MYFSKKLFWLLSFVGIILGTQELQGKDISRILTVLDKALESELTYLNNQISKKADFVEADFAAIMETAKTKFTHVFKHNLTEQERSTLAALLVDLKALCATTENELEMVAQVLSSEEDMTTFKMYLLAIKMSFPSQKISDGTQAIKACIRGIEKLDLNDSSLDVLRIFVCKYLRCLKYFVTYEKTSEQNQQSELMIYHFEPTSDVVLNVVGSDPFRSYHWPLIQARRDDFTKQGRTTFAIVHYATSQLLEAIGQ